MALLKQSTAYTRMFLLVQSSDHINGLTAASPTVNVSKAGGAFAAAGGTVTEIANGWYKIALTTTDTNTLGDLAYHITAASADPTDFTDQVVAFDTQDAAALGLSRIDAAISSRMATFTLPTNFSLLAIDGSGDVTYNNAAPPSAATISAQVLTTALTESYAALHAAPTLSQIAFEIRGLLAEKAVSSTTLTVKKIDGSTTAETFTLNDATAPTSITRAT